MGGGFQRGLSEGFSPSSAAARPFEQRRETEGHGIGVSFTLVTDINYVLITHPKYWRLVIVR